ncbi:hypothetical protein QBC34DRAFT_382629 [Podospora aff. communis PSN243]|uniref:Uncharacterized protein n=1 Tax=Podospora aff. communis PSN243 TaxID=3040156 RepID=A0AAV9GHB4_9PEZI|nr:hypothetical protein QBC34DRAFT_382629 [Podospora aff. communis PSN243]
MHHATILFCGALPFLGMVLAVPTTPGMTKLPARGFPDQYDNCAKICEEACKQGPEICAACWAFCRLGFVEGEIVDGEETGSD